MSPSADPRRGLGRRGEEIAADHLTRLGYRVLERNYRCATGEIDIVAEEDGCLVLVEVRTRRGHAFGSPEESVTPAKQERLRRLAEAYLQAHEAAPTACRVDVVAVEMSPAGRLLRVEVIKDALA